MDPLWSETCRSTFKYFIILIVSTNYIFVRKLDKNVFIIKMYAAPTTLHNGTGVWIAGKAAGAESLPLIPF